MSLILDALNRSDPDRTDPGSVPGLQSVHGPREPAPLPLWRRLLWPALAVAFGSVALGLWYTGNRDVTPAVSTAAPVEPQSQVTAVAPAPETREREELKREPQIAAAPSTAPAPATTGSPALDADVAALYREQPVAPRAKAAVATPEPAAEKEPVEAPATNPPLDVDALARAAEAALEQRARTPEPVVEHAAPFITELRQHLKDQIPSIFYSEHNWASLPAERSVVLNRERFTEGQQVKPGLRLLEILPDSIVLEFQGTEFRLKSLNSWVNL